MAVPIINDWAKYFNDPDEGLGSSYERVILNQLLNSICEIYHIQSALETPCFGFTGVSGINLVNLAKHGIKVSLEDHDLERINKINELWQELRLHTDIKYNPDYVNLDYPDKHFDLGFNFSALWFTQNIRSFLAEFCRVCKKAILICVPNRDGIGFKMQMKDYSPEKYPYLHPAHLDVATIKYLMKRNKWLLQKEDYIDCPPWPDIGMKKELFFKKITGKKDILENDREPVSILSYYQEENSDFIPKMLSYGFVEKVAPHSFKKYWAHHYYLLFTPENG